MEVVMKGGENMQEIVQIISTVGFPIAMCVMLLWYIKYILDNHKAETNQFVSALNNNTLALQRLCDKLGGSDL